MSAKPILDLDGITFGPVAFQTDVFKRMVGFVASHVNEDSKLAVVQHRGLVVSMHVSVDPLMGMYIKIVDKPKNGVQEKKKAPVLLMSVKWMRTGGENDMPHFKIETASTYNDSLMALVLALLKVLGGGRSTAVLEDRSWISGVPARKFHILSKQGERFYNDLGFKSLHQAVDGETYKKMMATLRTASAAKLIASFDARSAALNDALQKSENVNVSCVSSDGRQKSFKSSSKEVQDMYDHASKLAINLKWALGVFGAQNQTHQTHQTHQTQMRGPTLSSLVENATKVDAARASKLIWELLPSSTGLLVEAVEGRSVTVSPEEIALLYASTLSKELYCDLGVSPPPEPMTGGRLTKSGCI